jgi:DHA2 family multidrug resistance protein
MQTFGEAIQTGSQEFKNVAAGLTHFAQQSVGSNMATAAQQGKYMIMQHVSKQAYIAGIDDDFWVAAIITFASLIPVLIMKTKTTKSIVKS